METKKKKGPYDESVCLKVMSCLFCFAQSKLGSASKNISKGCEKFLVGEITLILSFLSVILSLSLFCSPLINIKNTTSLIEY